MKRTLLCLLFATLVSAIRAEAALPTRIAVPREIIRQPGATQAERRAADDLAQTLHQITGAKYTVREAETAADVPESAIIVGPGAVARSIFPEVPLNAFGGEQIALHTKGKRLLLAGGRPRGTLYAVYHFLQDQCGVRWWMPWATTIPRNANLSISALNVKTQPAFESRDTFWYPAFDGDWAAHNFSNSQQARLTDAQGGKIVYKGFVHTFYSLVPPEDHFAAHPEWYSLIGGKRTVDRGQLCLTNPELKKFVVERVKQWLRETPNANIVSISQNDGPGWCECPNCAALDKREGSHAGSLLAFVNDVAAEVGKTYPHVTIDTLAYQYTRKPPLTIRPRPNVVVRLCSVEGYFAAPLDDPSNAAFANDLRAWGKLSRRLYVWDYTTDFAHYVMPYPNWFVLGPNLRFFADNGVQGVLEEGAHQSNGAEMAEMRAWVLARLLWNPHQDDQALIREFLRGYYGPAAAGPIWQYLQLMHTAAHGYYLGINAPPTAPYLTFDTLNRAEELWQQAETAAASDPEKLWRVRQGHLPVRYVYLVRWTSLRRACLEEKAHWPLPESRKAVADTWLAVATGPGPAGWTPMTHVNEQGLTPQVFVARFANDPPANNLSPSSIPLPADIPGATGIGAVDAQEDLARLEPTLVGQEADIRADQAASNGLSAWMPGASREWSFQLPVSDLPERARTGKWKVYAVIRMERKPGAAPGDAAEHAPAFSAGVYDTTARISMGETAVPLTDAASAYRSYLVGIIDMKASEYVWIAPAANPGVQSIWVDRVFFVPAK